MIIDANQGEINKQMILSPKKQQDSISGMKVSFYFTFTINFMIKSLKFNSQFKIYFNLVHMNM